MTQQEHHATLVQYLLAKVERRDWHGVSDAANDLRVLEAQMENAPVEVEITGNGGLPLELSTPGY